MNEQKQAIDQMQESFNEQKLALGQVKESVDEIKDSVAKIIRMFSNNDEDDNDVVE